jgi:hypothetical protein
METLCLDAVVEVTFIYAVTLILFLLFFSFLLFLLLDQEEVAQQEGLSQVQREEREQEEI